MTDKKEQQIVWEKVQDYMKLETEKSQIRLFAVLYNFLYENVGTGKSVYCKPIVEQMPHIVSILNDYFELEISVDKETKKEIFLLRAKGLKKPNECKEA